MRQMCRIIENFVNRRIAVEIPAIGVHVRLGEDIAMRCTDEQYKEG